VRCRMCMSDEHCTTNCDTCHGTGWLSHPHDFLMLKRIAKPGEAAYEWLVLLKQMTTTMQDVYCIPHPERGDIYVYPADKWARAVKEQ